MPVYLNSTVTCELYRCRVCFPLRRLTLFWYFLVKFSVDRLASRYMYILVIEHGCAEIFAFSFAFSLKIYNRHDSRVFMLGNSAQKFFLVS